MFRSPTAVIGIWLTSIALSLNVQSGHAWEATVPVVAGPEGQRAFADLAKFYHHEKTPPFEQAIKDLKSSDAAMRVAAGKYLLALVVQAQADESNGRGNWQERADWGGGAESDARRFRKSFAEKLAAQAKGPEVLDAAIWLVQEDKQVENQKNGVTLLCRIESPRSAEIYRQLLSPPHHTQAVLLAILEEASRRKLVTLQPEVRSLATIIVRRFASRLGALRRHWASVTYQSTDRKTPSRLGSIPS